MRTGGLDGCGDARGGARRLAPRGGGGGRGRGWGFGRPAAGGGAGGDVLGEAC